AVVEDRQDSLGGEAACIVDDGDGAVLIDDDLDLGRDLVLLAGIERIVEQLLDQHQRPLLYRVTGLVDQLLLAAELHQAGDAEGDARELMPALGRSRHNRYNLRSRDRRLSLLKSWW